MSWNRAARSRSIRGLRVASVGLPAKPVAVLSLLLVMLIWGSTFVVTKSAVAEMPPLVFAVLRFAVASTLLMVAARMTGALAALPRPLPLGTLALMGLAGVTIYFAAFNIGLVFTSATDGALIQGAIPAVSALVAAVYLRERAGPVRAFGIAASMLGVAFVVLSGAGTADTANRIVGDTLMFGTVVAWAVYSLLGRRLRASSGLGITAVSTALGTIFLLPAAIVELVTQPAPVLTTGSVLSVLYLGAAASALAFWLWNRALTVLDVSQSSVFINLVPLVGVVSATLVLGEPLALTHLVGGGLILLGVALCLR